MLIIESQVFNWNSETKIFSTNASVLEELVKNDPQYHDRIMYVNGRWGFFVKSERTGKVIWFERNREYRNADGKLESVIYVSPELADVKLIVIND